MCINHLSLVPTTTQRGCHVSCNWRNRRLLDAMWVLGIKLRALEEQPVLLIVELFPWSHIKFFHYYHYYYLLACAHSFLASVLSFQLSEDSRDWIFTAKLSLQVFLPSLLSDLTSANLGNFWTQIYCKSLVCYLLITEYKNKISLSLMVDVDWSLHKNLQTT